MTDEEKGILNNLKEYMQDSIDKGYHKFVYNDLGADFKCIDCINVIDNVLNREEQLKDIQQQICNEELFEKDYIIANYISKDKIKAKIDLIDKEYADIIEKNKNDLYLVIINAQRHDAMQVVLQELLEKE